MTGTRPKRARTDVEDPPPLSLADLEKDEELWFDDGNIVLIARDVGFRIFRSLLAKQSPVFSDMFASANPRAGEDYDGCPIVHLSDSPEDIRHLLRILIPSNRQRYYDDTDIQPPFSEALAVARLAHKYDIEDVLQQSTALLKEHFPSKLQDYSAPDDGSTAIAAVNFARLTGTNSMLPVALYVCCGLGSSLLDGYLREDGSREYLERDDLGRCLDGRDRLAKEAFSLISRIFTPHPHKQCSQSFCETYLRVGREEAFQHTSAGVAATLDEWQPWIEDTEWFSDLCEHCSGMLVQSEEEERHKTWKLLPEMFSMKVDDWDGSSDDDG